MVQDRIKIGIKNIGDQVRPQAGVRHPFQKFPERRGTGFGISVFQQQEQKRCRNRIRQRAVFRPGAPDKNAALADEKIEGSGEKPNACKQQDADRFFYFRPEFFQIATDKIIGDRIETGLPGGQDFFI